MAWRIVVITSAARLKIENDQLCIIRDSTVTVPVEDIGVLLVESQEVTVTAPTLCRLADAGAVVLFCDGKHLPAFVGLPYSGHSRVSGMHRLQLSTTVPFRKRCWQAITRQKISNQAACLKYQGNPAAISLYELAMKVQSGDAGNVEAVAAQKYFRLLFGGEFARGNDEYINGALDYGYAVVRSAVARALAAHGFLLTQGIHHRSELNPFNLADDFIEPFRPAVDLMVSDMVFDEDDGLTSRHRAGLAGILTMEVLINNSRQCIMNATEICAASFVSACKAGDHTLLQLPDLLPLTEHSYE